MLFLRANLCLTVLTKTCISGLPLFVVFWHGLYCIQNFVSMHWLGGKHQVTYLLSLSCLQWENVYKTNRSTKSGQNTRILAQFLNIIYIYIYIYICFGTTSWHAFPYFINITVFFKLKSKLGLDISECTIPYTTWNLQWHQGILL